MLTATGAAFAEAVTDGADPITWVQAALTGGGISVIALLIVYLFRLILRSAGESRTESRTEIERQDRQIAAQDTKITALNTELDEQRDKRRKAEDAQQRVEREKSNLEREVRDCRLEIARLQSIMTRMAERKAGSDEAE